MLQQNDAYSTQVLQLKQNVCNESFSGETFQPQQYESDDNRKPAEFVHLVILLVLTAVLSRTEVCSYAAHEENSSQDDIDVMLQQNEAYSTQMWVQPNVCCDFFSGENFQQQRYNYNYVL